MAADKKVPQQVSTHLTVGERVIMRDGQHGTVAQIDVESLEHRYTVRLGDGSLRVVEADELLRARTYAGWMAPGTGWTGEERREARRRVGERRKGENRSPDHRTGQRRSGDRRKP